MNCDVLYRNSRRLIMHQSLEFKRELYSKINWNARFIGIKGPVCSKVNFPHFRFEKGTT